MSVGDKITRVLYEVNTRYGKKRKVKKEQILEIMKRLNLDSSYLGRIISSLRDYDIV